MDYSAWQLKRRELQGKEMAERSRHLEAARPDMNKSINEQALRELYDLTAALADRMSVLEKRGK